MSTSMMSSSIANISISVHNITKHYDMKSFTVHALRNISFDAKTGEFIGLIGPSGCGKTTLINIIAGLLTPTSGSVIINNIDITTMSAAKIREFRLKTIGLIFQDHLLIDALTARENVEMPGIFGKIPQNQRHNRAFELLKLVKMENKAEHLPSELSGGEQQRVGIARALFFDPKIILADEPTGDLDSKTGRLIIQNFKEIAHETQKSIIVVSHDPRHFKYFDRVLKMNDGSLTI